MKRLIFLFVPLLALLALIGWRLNVKQNADAAQTQQRQARMKAPPMVSVAPAQVRDIVQTFDSVGTVESPFNVKLASRISGQIDYLQVREGDRVTQGQLLVRLNPVDLNSQLQQQEAALAEAQYRLAQAQITQNPNDVSVNTQVHQQRAGLATAQANYNQTVQNYDAQVAAAQAAVTDAQGRINNADAAIRSANAAIASAQANLDDATAKYNRTDTLYKQGFVAAQDVDDALAARKVQESAVDVARSQLNAADATRDSAVAQKQSAQQQLNITITKGKADIESARAAVVQAHAGLEYANANIAQKPAYQQNLAALKAAVTAAEDGVRSAKALLADTVLTSPINGYVTARAMDPGSMATPGMPILTLQTIHDVWVTVSVPEEVSRHIRLGQNATAVFDALPGREFVGKIIQINQSADPLSRQFMVRLSLDNRYNLIKPGMFARVTIETQHIRGAVVVPREAVQQGQKGPTVIVVDNASVAQHRPVTLGASDPAGIAIIQGVQPGEKVVTLSALPIKDGQSVHVGSGTQPGA